MDIKTALGKVVDQLDLSTEEMQDVMRQIMTGQCTDVNSSASVRLTVCRAPARAALLKCWPCTK